MAFYKCAVCFPDVPGALVKRKSKKVRSLGR